MVPTTIQVERSSDNSDKEKPRTWMLVGCIVGALFLVACLVQVCDQKFHDANKGVVVTFAQDSTTDDNIDDDTTRDDVCKQYLMKFLNGTTDARDECEGMLNAYQAGDCRNFGSNSLGEFEGNDDDTNKTDDDVLIDDAYEAWECCSSIYKYYTGHCHEPELASFQLLGIVLVLVLCGLVKSLIQTLDIMWIPDAAGFCLVGSTVGGIIKLISPRLALVNDQNLRSFNNNLFLHIFLPPIVFASSLKIDKRAFWRHVGPILTFAIVGTAMSAVLIGLMTYGLTMFDDHTTKLPLLDSLLFGALASSIDPVATLGILDAVGASKTDTLYALVFGESLLNDGVAIVLFEALVRHVGDFRSRASLHDTLVRFLVVSGGSVGIGIGCGFLCMLYYVTLRNRHSPVVEVAMFFCWALIPYYICDALELSGIIAIMTTGFVMDYYIIGGCQSEEAQWMDYVELECLESVSRASQGFGSDLVSFFNKVKTQVFSGRGSMSRRSARHVGFVSEVIATTMEMAIFAYLGLFLFSDKYMIDVRLNATAVLSCIVARGVMVIVLSCILNFCAWLDLGSSIRRWMNRRSTSSRIRQAEEEGESYEDEETTVESSLGSADIKIYLTRDTQLILFLSGVRGAVSFALVENLPVYNGLTRMGSPYKAELKAMTSTSILFTLFVFGAATYFTIQKQQQVQQQVQQQPQRGRHRLTQRLLSQPLASFDDESRDVSLDTPAE